MTLFRSIDFESTGFHTETEKHALCEVGYTDIIIKDGAKPLILEPVAELCNPGRPMPIEAQSIHHISDRDLAGKPAPERLLMKLHSADADYYIAHNVDHEKTFFTGGETPWLCTYKSALRVWPDAPGHNLSMLRYWLKIDDDPDFERELSFPVHRSGPDSYVGAFIFTRLLGVASVEEMTRWSTGPALLAVCYMKKHKGTLWRDVPVDYLDWILEGKDRDTGQLVITDRDVRATAKYYWKLKTTEKQSASAATSQEESRDQSNIPDGY